MHLGGCDVQLFLCPCVICMLGVLSHTRPLEMYGLFGMDGCGAPPQVLLMWNV